jgi:hypothetical protein
LFFSYFVQENEQRKVSIKMLMCSILLLVSTLVSFAILPAFGYVTRSPLLHTGVPISTATQLYLLPSQGNQLVAASITFYDALQRTGESHGQRETNLITSAGFENRQQMSISVLQLGVRSFMKRATSLIKRQSYLKEKCFDTIASLLFTQRRANIKVMSFPWIGMHIISWPGHSLKQTAKQILLSHPIVEARLPPQMLYGWYSRCCHVILEEKDNNDDQYMVLPRPLIGSTYFALA